MRLWDAFVEWFDGPIPTIPEMFPTPPGFLEHKDHMSVCPECSKHFLCREVVCRLCCARCWPDVKK